MLSVLLPFVSQYASHLYCNTPPISIAALLGKSWWLWSPGCSPVLESQRPATGLRTPKSPKVPGRLLERVPGRRGLLGGTAGSSAGRPVSLEKQRNGTAPSSPPSSPLFPGTLPSSLPGTFGDLGVLSPVAGRWDSNPSTWFRKTREGWNCRFQNSPRTEGGDKVPAVWTQGSRQVCLSRCPKS